MAKDVRFCGSAAAAPSLPGAYVIAIDLAEPVAVKLGGLPAIDLPAGRYLYCGSAKGPGGLKARLSRHFRRGKPVHWHIDQLTERGNVAGSWVFPDGNECELVRELSELPIPIPGFGSSDCTTCRGHLLRWPNGRDCHRSTAAEDLRSPGTQCRRPAHDPQGVALANFDGKFEDIAD